jgi:hypothetical protein
LTFKRYKLLMKQKCKTSLPQILNHLFSEKLIRQAHLIGYSISKRLGNYLPNKQNLFLGACFGPSIGILKPYYIGYLDPKSEDRQALIIVQNEETLQNQADIYGPANWTRGLYELTYKLGLHFDVNLGTNKNDLYLLQKWTTGARLDLFPQGLNVLYKTETQSFFSIYLSYKLGSNP